MSPVSWSLKLYHILSPYFLSDLIGNRDTEIINKKRNREITRSSGGFITPHQEYFFLTKTENPAENRYPIYTDTWDQGYQIKWWFLIILCSLYLCVPSLSSVPFVPCSFLVVCSIYSCLLFIVSGVWSISIFGPFGISPDIPRYLRHDMSLSLEVYVRACLPRTVTPWHVPLSNFYILLNLLIIYQPITWLC
jgi:hypothetical protein